MIEVEEGSKLRWAETEEEFLRLVAEIPKTNPCPNEDPTSKEHQEWQQELVLELMLNTGPFFDEDNPLYDKEANGPQNGFIGWIGCLWIDHEKSLGNTEGYDWEKDFVPDEGLLVFIIDEAQKEVGVAEGTISRLAATLSDYFYDRAITDGSNFAMKAEAIDLCIEHNIGCESGCGLFGVRIGHADDNGAPVLLSDSHEPYKGYFDKWMKKAQDDDGLDDVCIEAEKAGYLH